ncbi:MAG: hypothetical protein WC488_00515 [Candidatus Micrarchaeia archaeon]
MIADLLKERRNQLLLALFALFLGGTLLYSKYSGLILLFAFFLFGTFSTVWKNKNARFLSLALLIVLSLANVAFNGVKFGIDFSGGTRIPVVLEHSVSESTMTEMVQIIKSRASVLGLTEVKVRAVGTSQIDVEVPGTDENLIKSIEDVLRHQGVFEGIVDGKVALSGEDILPGTIYSISATQLSGADWGVGFSVTRSGADAFAQTVKGKAEYPLYMFLDRPKDAAIFISLEDLKGGKTIADKDVLEMANKSLRLDGDDIQLFILDDFGYNATANGTKALVSANLDNSTKEKIRSLGFNVTEVEDIKPVFRTGASARDSAMEQWPAIGLLSAPRLSAGVTNGVPSYGYSITGAAQGVGTERAVNAQNEVKKITSILKGGSLPVQISLGSRTSIPAPLGQQFLQLSLLGILASIIAISLFVSVRYRHWKLVLPIVAVSISELIILVSLLGSFTIDLAGMAGILAALGVGVDSQIVITDELAKKDGKNHEEKLSHAFDIITTNVAVAVVAMLPLLFSGMVEIIGFALSTIIGSLLGFMLSRPVYALLVEKLME